MSQNPWSADFTPPAPLRTERVRLEPLRPEVVELDYAAIMESRARLRAELRWGRGWPADDFTVDDNRKDLADHFAEFERRQAYAYTVLDPSGSRCLGCIYVEPWEGDARLAFWVIDDEVDTSLEAHLLAVLFDWFETEWLFARVIIPLRPENRRGVAVAQSLEIEELETGGLDGHVTLIWTRR